MLDLLDGQSVEVQGSARRPYVLKNVGGVLSCSCPAWRFQSLPIGAVRAVISEPFGATLPKNAVSALHCRPSRSRRTGSPRPRHCCWLKGGKAISTLPATS